MLRAVMAMITATANTFSHAVLPSATALLA
jgi:hypothetical protein